jgi:hypothetical protein
VSILEKVKLYPESFVSTLGPDFKYLGSYECGTKKDVYANFFLDNPQSDPLVVLVHGNLLWEYEYKYLSVYKEGDNEICWDCVVRLVDPSNKYQVKTLPLDALPLPNQ